MDELMVKFRLSRSFCVVIKSFNNFSIELRINSSNFTSIKLLNESIFSLSQSLAGMSLSLPFPCLNFPPKYKSKLMSAALRNMTSRHQYVVHKPAKEIDLILLFL